MTGSQGQLYPCFIFFSLNFSVIYFKGSDEYVIIFRIKFARIIGFGNYEILLKNLLLEMYKCCLARWGNTVQKNLITNIVVFEVGQESSRNIPRYFDQSCSPMGSWLSLSGMVRCGRGCVGTWRWVGGCHGLGRDWGHLRDQDREGDTGGLADK